MDIEKQNKIPFEELGLIIPNYVKDYSYDNQKEIYEYLKQLDTLEKKAFTIAQNHLGTPFHIGRSNGFKDWIKKEALKND
jgi:hypothetical protein